MSPFRCNAKNFSLTYSNPFNQPGWDGTTFTKEQLNEHLCSLPGVGYSIVSKEAHENGDWHFHALVTFKKKKDIRQITFFDVHGVHTNIQSCQSVPAWTTYLKKDGDWVESEQQNLDIGNAARTLGYEQFLQWVHDHKVQFALAKEMWRTVRAKDECTISAAGEGTECTQLFNFSFDFGIPRALVLLGYSGCGKTSWAKRNAPKPALFVRHIDQLAQFDSEKHKSIIFDDMDFKHWPRTAQIHLVDKYEPTTVNRRYGFTIIPKETVRIFTANEPIFLEDAAIERRVHTVKINF